MRRFGSARLRIGVPSSLRSSAPSTGHGRVWHGVLGELTRLPSVKLVSAGRADVWLGAATDPPPGRPLVVQLHEVGWVGDLRRFLEPQFARRLEAVVGESLAAASSVITPSRVARQQVIDAYGWDGRLVHAVHHGVNHDQFRPGVPGACDLVGAPYVLCVGVFHARKNLEALRSAMASLVAAGLPQVLAVVAGPAPDRPEPADVQAELELAGAPGRVRLMRGVDDAQLAALMSGCDAFCLPSFFEGFGLPALEAMACGAPVIVSDRGALPEVVDDGGLVVSPEPEAVRSALLRVLTEPGLADRLRAAGVERASGFSWRRTAEGWLEALRLAA